MSEDISRLRAYVAVTAPIVKAAVELRAMGRTLEQIESDMQTRGNDGRTKSMTPWLIVHGAYQDALKQFDAAVKSAGLARFEDLLTIADFAPFPNKDTSHGNG